MVVNLRDNDLGKRTTISLRLHARKDFARLVQWFPGVRKAWSSLLPRSMWQRYAVSID